MYEGEFSSLSVSICFCLSIAKEDFVVIELVFLYSCISSQQVSRLTTASYTGEDVSSFNIDECPCR